MNSFYKQNKKTYISSPLNNSNNPLSNKTLFRTFKITRLCNITLKIFQKYFSKLQMLAFFF